MKEEMLGLLRDVRDPSLKLNVLREYIQALALRSLHESEAFADLSFVGGTALRFVFNLPRFSEGLDFSLERKSGYKPEAWLKKLKRDLAFSGFDVSVSWNDKTTVHKAWIKVAEVLAAAGLAAMKDQKLSIKLEIDTNPPAGAALSNVIITKHRLMAIRHHDISSLMAGKVHALLTRKYPKGRDWYDFLWCRGHRPPVEPNLVLLQNALDQTQGKGAVAAGEWKDAVKSRIEHIDCGRLVDDVLPFLEHPEEGSLISLSNIISILNA